VQTPIQIYILHMGGKNKKIRGELKEIFEYTTGKRFLVGRILLKRVQYKDRRGVTRTEDWWENYRLDVTSLQYTRIR
jgi:hypothetical protein